MSADRARKLLASCVAAPCESDDVYSYAQRQVHIITLVKRREGEAATRGAQLAHFSSAAAVPCVVLCVSAGVHVSKTRHTAVHYGAVVARRGFGHMLLTEVC